MSAQDYIIHEFYPDLISPNSANFMNQDQGGSKICVIGKPNSGKSCLVKYLIASKRHLIPVGVAMNGTEESTGFYSKIFPPLFVYNDYQSQVLEDIRARQTDFKHKLDNPWIMVILDDCTDAKGVFKSSIQSGIFKNGRHWKMLYVLVLQYCIDLPPGFRTCVDGVFIFKENNEKILKNLYENYAGVFPKYSDFKYYMDNITGDYTALYIDNQNQTTKPWQDCIYYVKAPQIDEIKFGCKEYRAYGKDRLDKKFVKK